MSAHSIVMKMAKYDQKSFNFVPFSDFNGNGYKNMFFSYENLKMSKT